MSATSHSAVTHGHGGGNGHGHGHGDGHAHPEIGFLKKYVFSIDHKIIGIQFLFLGLMFFVVGGLLAMLIRWQLAWPDELQTGDKGHPIPILAKSLWAKVDTTLELGKIASIDQNNKTVTLNGVAAGDTRKGDSVNIKTGSGEVAAQVLDVDGRDVMVDLLGAPASATIKVGDAVMGKRVPGPMPTDFYTMVFSMHATIMIFLVIIPLLVGTFGNYLIPLKIGAGDMAFPFLNGLAFWSALPAGAIMVASFFMPGGAAAAGWTSYPPLSSIQQNGRPWEKDAWFAYERPEGISGSLASFVRIGGHVVDFESPKYEGKSLTAEIAEDTPAPLIEKTKSAVNAALVAYKKMERKDLKGVSGEVRTEGGRAKVVFTGADEPTARKLLTLAQDKMRWQGTWSDASLIAGFLAMFGMCGFICAYFMRFQSLPANILVGTLLSLVGGYFLTKGAQFAAFDGQSAWFMALIWLGFSSLMGGINYLTTIIKLRCPGMTMFRMPLSVWSLFITSLLVVLATPVLASALLLNLLDHHRITSFFLPLNWTRSNQLQQFSFGDLHGTLAGGGYPILHQHLFWFYSHPAVYIMILPAMGMVSDIIAVFARKPIFGYRPMVYAMAGIAFLGFIVWAHHMFQSGMNPTLGTTFAISTMFIAVPSAIKTFNWLGTLWRGNIKFTTPMLNALAFVSMFVIGGLSGIFMASTAVDVHIHDTYFIVAHIHYVLFGGSTFGIFGAIYFWYPKMFGRMMNETLGKIHFWLSFITFNGTFFAMHILGMRGMPRRIADYRNYIQSFADLHGMNLFISMCAFGLGLAQLPFIINFIGSWIWGKKAPQNPWEATTLEWVDAPTPPPHGNFEKVPLVYHGPYEYSTPLVEEDWLPQTRYVEGAEELVAKGH
jgi:heme/copper-type cytochrome/quinol oxidase subunit 1